MKSGKKFKIAVYLFGLAGTTIFVTLLAREGAGDVMNVVAAAGWGLAAVAAFHIIPLALDALGWRVLFPKNNCPGLRSLFWMRWIGESVNNLVPLQVGGDILRARLAAIRGTPVPVAAASVLVNLTVNVFTQILFTLSGFALLITATKHTDLEKPALAGALVSILAVGGFYAVQRFGGIRLMGAMISKIAGPGWNSFVQNAEALDREIKALYSRRRDMLACGIWTTVSWVAGAGEIWIALYALGIPASIVHALVFESVSQGFRSAMFFIPGALGVQEGGYLFVGGVIGIPGETALALALIRRVRELLIGVPGLLVWQFLEGNRLHNAATSPSP